MNSPEKNLNSNTASELKAIAQTILEGFNKHYGLFRGYCHEAWGCFENADWSRSGKATRERILSYEERVNETVTNLNSNFPDTIENTDLWPEIKADFIALLMDHLQAECAETFYNSVACRVLHRDYYNNKYIFWRPGLSTEHLHGPTPTYRSYYPPATSLRRSLLDIISSFKLGNSFQHLRRDIRNIEKSIAIHRGKNWRSHQNEQIQVYSSLFFRNKGAYIVCRMVNGSQKDPLVIALLLDDQKQLYVDTALLRRKDVDVLFSFSRAYFMVDMEVTSACVRFLKSIMPGKTDVDLNAILGLQKQAKTLFYRELQHHLRHSRDNFQIAPGIPGMVMLVFTLPSFPFVFKLIKDRFEPPKTSSREDVREKYQLVKFHDRVGRLADTLEFSNVAIPLDRIEANLLAQLRDYAAETIDEHDNQLVLQHVYIERRMEPLDRYLAKASGPERRRAIHDFGNAIRELAAADIFPGDMLKKNFGVTRNRRVVFYDYDEICYISECNFRHIPPSRYAEDEMSDTPWYSIGENDVFPESFGTFFFANTKDFATFNKDHEELMDADWWNSIKDTIIAGDLADVYPYPVNRRFSVRFKN